MEYRNVAWEQIMEMPYGFFIKDLKWKRDLDDEKRKAEKEINLIDKGKTERALRKKNSKYSR
jgi:hypothetical protein